MKTIINYEKIKKDLGITFENEKDILDFIKRNIEDLYYHNKNYNNNQWVKIQDLKDLLDNIDMEV